QSSRQAPPPPAKPCASPAGATGSRLLLPPPLHLVDVALGTSGRTRVLRAPARNENLVREPAERKGAVRWPAEGRGATRRPAPRGDARREPRGPVRPRRGATAQEASIPLGCSLPLPVFPLLASLVRVLHLPLELLAP